jgi:hypothetical protein
MLALSLFARLDVSAASGLVVSAGCFFVIADDELTLAAYDRDGRPQPRIPLWPGSLPETHTERKRAKPDLEALCELPDGTLLALGSGSTAQRERGALVDLGAGRTVREIELAPLYRTLRDEFPELNIEGAVVHDNRLWLAQRGNGQSRSNGVIELDSSAVISGLRRGAISADGLRRVHPVVLGDADGIALGLTDLAADAQSGLLFSAAAEDTPNSYDDGACTSSVVGRLGNDGRVLEAQRVDTPCKIEGLAAVASDGAGVDLWLVADPDDRTRPAPLYRARYELGKSPVMPADPRSR